MTQQDTQPPAETLAEAQEIAIHFALPGMYDGISTHATRRGDADDKPYMRAILAALTRRAGGDAIPNSWSRSAEDTRAMALLLAEVELHLKASRIFITTREKMHPCGVELHDELAAKVTAALDNLGRENVNARR